GKAVAKRIPSYLAFVVAPGQPIRRVELGAAKPIDDTITGWRQTIKTGGNSAAPAVLARLVWEPIAKALPAGTHTLYLSPDGDLARVPWCALPGSTPGKVLLEEFTGGIAVVPHGPFLLEQLKYPPKFTGPDGV